MPTAKMTILPQKKAVYGCFCHPSWAVNTFEQLNLSSYVQQWDLQAIQLAGNCARRYTATRWKFFNGILRVRS